MAAKCTPGSDKTLCGKAKKKKVKILLTDSSIRRQKIMC